MKKQNMEHHRKCAYQIILILRKFLSIIETFFFLTPWPVSQPDPMSASQTLHKHRPEMEKINRVSWIESWCWPLHCWSQQRSPPPLLAGCPQWNGAPLVPDRWHCFCFYPKMKMKINRHHGPTCPFAHMKVRHTGSSKSYMFFLSHIHVDKTQMTAGLIKSNKDTRTKILSVNRIISVIEHNLI